MEASRNAMFCGSKINFTENRAVLHIALRNKCDKPIIVDGVNVMPKVKAALQHMKEFTEEVSMIKFSIGFRIQIPQGNDWHTKMSDKLCCRLID